MSVFSIGGVIALRQRFRLRYLAAFTLIELIASIAIIGILAGLMIPALGRARIAAKKMYCINNQRQIGLGVLQYVADNENTFPPHKQEVSGILWAALLLRDEYASGSLFYCPEDLNRKSTAEGLGDSARSAALVSSSIFHRISYGSNYRFITGGGAIDASLFKIPAKISEVRNQSETIFLSDCRESNVEPSQGYSILNPGFTTSSFRGVLTSRHGGSLNVLWIDGRASGESVGSSSDCYTGKFAEWNNPLSSIWDRE